MKYTYSYKTSDGVRHEGVYSAASVNAVYVALRSKGVKPFDVRLAPGLANGLLSVMSSRRLLAALLSVLSVALFLALLFGRSKNAQNGSVDIVATSARHQVIGDSALIELGIKTGWSFVFDKKGDQFLASFAVPGAEPAVRTVELSDLRMALRSDVPVKGDDSLEARQIKVVVAGMKREMFRYLAAGGDERKYVDRLIERQSWEGRYRSDIEKEYRSFLDRCGEDSVREARWASLNEKLRKIGLRLLPHPSKDANEDFFEN